MKKRKTESGILPALFSTLALLAVFLLFGWLYRTTRYLPLLLIGLATMLPAGMNLLVIVFGKGEGEEMPGAPRTAKATKSTVKTDGEEEEEALTRKEIGARLWQSVKTWLRAIPPYVANFCRRNRRQLQMLCMAALFVGTQIYYFKVMRRVLEESALAYWHVVLLIAVFVLGVILDKWCKHAPYESPYVKALLKNVRTTLFILRITLPLTALAIMIKAMGFYDLQRYFVIGISVLFYYVSCILPIAVAVLFIRREIGTAPRIVIPLPFAGGDMHEFSFINFLEENTGITMRSLWSIKVLRNVAPYTVIIVAVVLWFSTGVVQIEPCEQAAVYRLGKLQGEMLQPGLHLTLPYPFDQVEIYDTENINMITIGYRSEQNSDNIWTAAHGTDEYALLLGSGDEVVSLNLRLEYKIEDLHAYLTSSAEPVRVMESQAYALVTERTISTDLDTMLSMERDVFAASFLEDLRVRLDKLNVGIEVTNVVLESIHPPVDVADVYQALISAGIQASTKILNAEGQAAVMRANAEAMHIITVNTAKAEAFESVAAATAEVTEFMAAVEANNAYPEAYQYYKYMNALQEAYGGAKLVIVGKGVDQSKLFFGSISN